MPAQPATPVLRVSALQKRFGSTVALTDGSVRIGPGEVHALVGENGSGKSTFVKILSGVQLPDAGSIEMAGRATTLASPREAGAQGISTVFQEVLVAPQRSVLQNVWVGTERVLRFPRAATDRRRHAADLLDRLVGGIDLGAPAGSFNLSTRQAICIVRALVRDPRLLILDEATSALDVGLRDRLFEILRERCAAGVSVLFISHKMDEIDELADRVTVMRAGRVVAGFDRGGFTTEELVRAMSGDETAVVARGGARSEPFDTTRGAAVTASGIVLRDGAPPFDLQVYAGELVGLAGLEGQGQELLLEALGGVRTPLAGAVSVGGETVRSQREASRRGIAYLPRDRRTEGIYPGKSILDNFALPTLGADRRGPFLARRSTAQRFGRFREMLAIKAPQGRASIESLSGGNQQKVIIARWLATAPTTLVLNDPTRGIDLRAKADIYAELRRRTQSGCAVVMVSTELDELLGIMDRVVVFREGSVFTELSGARLTRDALLAAYFGRELR